MSQRKVLIIVPSDKVLDAVWLASGNGNDNFDSQVVPGVANVHVGAVLL